MKLNSSIRTFIALFLFAATAAKAEDPVTTRRVDGQSAAAGAEIIINQIDVSQYPKVTIFSTILRDGRPVPNLTSADFRIREDEVDQEPLTVVPKLTPLAAVITMDVSGSMRKALPTAQQAAANFVDSLTETDQAAVIAFSREVKTAVPFTSNKAIIKNGISATTARGDTALFDALYASVEALKGSKGRKAIVVLSDGVDDDGTGKQLSKHQLSEILALAREVNVPIFTIGLGKELDETTLTTVAAESGGRYYNAPSPADLQGLFDRISEQLSGQYNIYYTSNLPGDGTPHRVQLSYQSYRVSKEYLSPQLETAAQSASIAAAAPTPAIAALPAENHPVKPEPVRISLGMSRISIPNIRDGEVSVLAGTGNQAKFIGRIRVQEPAMEVAAGDYTLKIRNLIMPGVNVKAGEVTEIVLGEISIPNLTAGDIGIEGLTNKGWAGSINPQDTTLQVFPGEYTFKIKGSLVSSTSVEPGKIAAVQLAKVEVPNIVNNSISLLYSEGAKWMGDFSSGNQVIFVPAGKYYFRQRSFSTLPFELQAGQNLRFELARISRKDTTGRPIEIKSKNGNAWAGTLDERHPTLDIIPGEYDLKIGAQVVSTVLLEAGKETVIE